MKATLVSKTGEQKGQLDLPNQFSEKVRTDIIGRAVLSLQSLRRTPYGSFGAAGKRHSADQPKRRRKYRGSYGTGMSRIPRKIMTRSGTQFYRVGAFAPGTVGGRRAHVPKPFKIFAELINKKEKRMAIRSAIAASADSEIVVSRGHNLPANYPLVFEQDFENLSRTKEVLETLQKLGFEKELERCEEKKVRAGKGKLRNRKYRRKTGLLIVVEKPCDLEKACQNIPGVDVVGVSSLNAEHLAPGSQPGRLTMWSKSAVEKLEKENLFM